MRAEVEGARMSQSRTGTALSEAIGHAIDHIGHAIDHIGHAIDHIGQAIDHRHRVHRHSVSGMRQQA
eukprot:1489325-Rhodomonas_salina.1